MSSTISDHEVLTFKRVQRRLDKLKDGGMRIKRSGALTDALNKLSCVPFFSFRLFAVSRTFEVGGDAAGTFKDPNVSVILQHSKPSAYGKGEETVFDETYRRGQEILAADITFKQGQAYGKADDLVKQLGDVVAETLFVGRHVEVKLYKLAIYQEGGHFDWHMDSTHSKEHHATILIALGSTWEGGDFILRRDGVEMRQDMKPEPETETQYSSLAAVAFYTDTEHKVEPVTSGTRIVLQYDVEVENGETDEGEQSSDEENDKMDPHYSDDGSIMHDLKPFREVRDDKKLSVPGNDAAVDEIIAILQRLFGSGKNEVAFALQHLYRKSSILPEFLKGSDSLLYQALIKAQTFEVTLHPVVLCETSDYEGSFNTVDSRSAAFIFDPHLNEEDSDSSESDHYRGPRFRGRVETKKTIFHISRSSALRRISYKDYIEHTGNEAQTGENMYFGGGMFVRPKRKGKRKGTHLESQEQK